MDRGEGRAAVLKLRDGGFDGLGNVEKLQVNEDLFALVANPLDEFIVTASHEKLQAQFVEEDGLAKRADNGFRLVNRGNVQGEDETFARLNAFLGQDGFVGHRRILAAAGGRWKEKRD